MNSDWLNPTPTKLFFKKNDPQDPRLGELVNIHPNLNYDSQQESELRMNQKTDFVLWGYPDDEGIKLNGGRPGAAEAPNKIREIFYKLTVNNGVLSSNQASFVEQNDFPKLFDLGDLRIDAVTLAERHERGRQLMLLHQTHNKKTITLGGGHDYGYPDSVGFCESWIKKGERPVVLNFDAHLDVRPLNQGLTSGTPFFRLLEKLSSEVCFVEIGIQNHCSSKEHAHYVLNKNGFIFNQDWINSNGYQKLLLQLKEICKNHPVFVSCDIDFFASHEAPGCSQSWPTGAHVQDFWPFYQNLLQIISAKGLGLYEVSPPLDNGLQTQRLASLIIYEFLHST